MASPAKSTLSTLRSFESRGHSSGEVSAAFRVGTAAVRRDKMGTCEGGRKNDGKTSSAYLHPKHQQLSPWLQRHGCQDMATAGWSLGQWPTWESVELCMIVVSLLLWISCCVGEFPMKSVGTSAWPQGRSITALCSSAAPLSLDVPSIYYLSKCSSSITATSSAPSDQVPETEPRASGSVNKAA